MSIYKSILKIPKSQCYREVNKLAMNLEQFNNMKKSYAWCSKFCKEFCMRSATEDCMSASKNFCKMNCSKSCFFVGITPTKIKE